MRETVIQGTGIRVSRLGYGTGALHRLFSASARQRLLNEATWLGIRHFDTAPSYGFGLAERDLGMFLRGRRSEFTVATKVGLYPAAGGSRHAAPVWARKAFGRVIPALSSAVANWNVARARQSLDESLRRLGADYVDFLFLHEPEGGRVPLGEFLCWLQDETGRGRIRAWGVAGLGTKIAPFVTIESPIAQVVQTLDSLERREADFLLACRRPLQFTYGYFCGAKGNNDSPTAYAEKILLRNHTGTVLVSTRRVKRLRTICQLVC